MKDGSGRKAGAPHPRRGRQRWTPYSNGPFIFDCLRDTGINLSTGALANSLHSKTGRSGTWSARNLCSALLTQGTATRPGKAVKRRVIMYEPGWPASSRQTPAPGVCSHTGDMAQGKAEPTDFGGV